MRTVKSVGPGTYSIREPLLRRWDRKEATQGELRKSLEESVWPRYSPGLWGEPWSEYSANLARAVQPYAHYTPDLMGWQMAILHDDGDGHWLVRAGPTAYDPLEASRITLLHGLVFWTLGRVAAENASTPELTAIAPTIKNLGIQLSRSKLLFKNRNWAVELAPHVVLRAGRDWRDE